MNTDFRLSIGLFTHPKFIKLERKLGEAGTLALIRLFAFVSQNRPDGILSKMDSEDIAIAANYKGDGEQLITALISVGFVDVDPSTGERSIHDWVEHNPWAAGARERTEKARKAAEARWGGDGNKKDDAKPVPPKSDEKPNPPTRPTSPAKPAPSTDKQSGSATPAMLNDASSMLVAQSSNAPNLPLPNPTYPYPNLPSPSGGVGGDDPDADDEEYDSGGSDEAGFVPAGGLLPIGMGDSEGAVLPLPSSVDAEKLVPEDLLSRFRASVYWAKWEAHLHSVLQQSKGKVRRPAMYLKPVIVRILQGKEPLPSEALAASQERTEQREAPAKNRAVVAEKPKMAIPDDWIPGASETEIRTLANQAFNRVLRVLGDKTDPLSEPVRNEARAIWRKLNPDKAMPWVPTSEEAPIPVIEAETPEATEVRSEIAESLNSEESYSLQNNPVSA